MYSKINLISSDTYGKRSNFRSLLTINSSPLRLTYMCQWIGSALVQIIACHIFGAKPLSQPMLGFCQLGTIRNPSEQTKVTIFIKIQINSCKYIWKYSAKWWPFCPEEVELTGCFYHPLCCYPSYSWILPTLVVDPCHFPDITCQTQVWYWQDLCGGSFSQCMLV